MEIRQLRYFVSVAEQLNFTAAAQELFVAQSAVSKQVAELESNLGVTLFIRNKRSVKLTSSGTIFLKEAKQLINQYDAAFHKARQANSGQRGIVKVGYINSAVKLFLPQIVKRFRHEFPNIDLSLQQSNLNELTKALKNGELDIGFTLAFRPIPGVAWKKIYSEDSSVVVHAEHPLANKESVKIAALAEESFIVQARQASEEGFNHVIKLCANAGFSPKIVCQPSNMESLLFLVESGIGVAIVPRFVKVYDNPSLRFLDIEGENINYDVVVAWKKDNPNQSIPFFLNQVRNQISA